MMRGVRTHRLRAVAVALAVLASCGRAGATPASPTSPTRPSSWPPPPRPAPRAGACGAAADRYRSRMTTLAERLGHPPDARLLIVNCDDPGSTDAANVGVYEALGEGMASSATLMVPCPWAREAAARYRGEDIGVHLTLNAEFDLYRWGPITHAPSLLDGDGGFPRTIEDVWDHADIDEVRKELRAQVERAILWGFDISHLDSHMGTVQLKPEFFDVYLELAVDLRLAFAALMILAAAGCYNGEAKPGPNDGGSLDFAITRTIVVDDAGIQPNVARVRVGTAVSVVNRGTKDHDVTSAAIDTGTLHPG